MRHLISLACAAISLSLGACGGGTTPAGSLSVDARNHDQTPWEQPVPKASCLPTDRVETALQGQVPVIDRLSGRSLQGYNCNLERVGHHEGDGAGWQMAWFDHCAYYGTASHFGTDSSTPMRPRANPGVVVMDVANPVNPQVAGYLDSVAMLDPWESLKVNEARLLLAGVNAQAGGGGPEIDIYDIAADCEHPQLLASKAVGTAVGHAGNFAPDGLTYYSGSTLRAIDVSDPTDPTLLKDDFPVGTHDISASEDGNRLYATITGLGLPQSNGLVILDSTEIQARVEDPQVEIVSEFYWDDGAISQMSQPITIAGKPYILYVDEGGSGLSTKHNFCARGLPPFAFARIIDVSDEKNPFTVSKLMLETHDPANCAETINDDQAIFLYDSHYCTVDNPDDARLVACSYFESGLRVFDIRDPYKPKEIAYYNAPLTPGYKEGSYYNTTGTCHTADWAGAHPRFVLERNEIWYTGQCTGFHVLRFTQPLSKLLGETH